MLCQNCIDPITMVIVDEIWRCPVCGDEIDPSFNDGVDYEAGVTECDMYGHSWQLDPDGQYRCVRCGEDQY